MKKTILSGLECLLGIIFLLGAYRVAADLYQPHLPPLTNLAERQANMAATFVTGKRTDLAIELGRKATETDPNSAEAHHILAVLLMQENRKEEAMAEFREAIRCKPDWVNPRMALGIVLGQSGRLEEAAEQFRAAGDHPDARHNLELTEQAIKKQKRQRPP